MAESQVCDPIDENDPKVQEAIRSVRAAGMGVSTTDKELIELGNKARADQADAQVGESREKK